MEAMIIAMLKNLALKEALKEYETSTRLTKTDKAQLQGQIKVLPTKIEAEIRKNQEPQQQSTRAMQLILKEMKTVQEMIQKYVGNLIELKEEKAKENPRGTSIHRASNKSYDEPNVSDRERSTASPA